MPPKTSHKRKRSSDNDSHKPAKRPRLHPFIRLLASRSSIRYCSKSADSINESLQADATSFNDMSARLEEIRPKIDSLRNDQQSLEQQINALEVVAEGLRLQRVDLMTKLEIAKSEYIATSHLHRHTPQQCERSHTPSLTDEESNLDESDRLCITMSNNGDGSFDTAVKLLEATKALTAVSNDLVRNLTHRKNLLESTSSCLTQISQMGVDWLALDNDRRTLYASMEQKQSDLNELVSRILRKSTEQELCILDLVIVWNQHR